MIFSIEDEDYRGPQLPRRYSDVVFPKHFYTVYKGKRERGCDKSRSKINLRDLTAMVKKNWETVGKKYIE